jgi:hypothetical protein
MIRTVSNTAVLVTKGRFRRNLSATFTALKKALQSDAQVPESQCDWVYQQAIYS